ncbi:MAG: hypothetical protein QXH08_06845 [Candidatus Hadarchaeales archaeon]
MPKKPEPVKKPETKASPWVPAHIAGPAAFYLGLIIAVVTIGVAPSGMLYVGLAILGIIIGLLNVTAKESGPYLFASIAFIVTATGIINVITGLTGNTFTGLLFAPDLSITVVLVRLAANLIVLVGAGAVIISVRAIYEIAKSR